jgi:hypothetical protein
MMALKAVKLYLLQVLMLIVLSSCSAGTTDETDNQVSTDTAKLQLFIKDINGNQVTSITSGNTLSLEAVLTDNANKFIENQEVNFTASSGTLSSASRLTDSNGLASVTYDSTGITPEVITVTLTTTYQDETLTISSQFEVLSVVEEDKAVLTITFKKDGDSTNRVQVGETAQLGVELKTESGQAISDTVINFTAELGTLSAATALTDASGTAEVTITGLDDQLGAALATASTTINNQIITDSLAYEVVNTDIAAENITLGHLNDSGEFQEGIKSTLTNSNATSTISAGGTLGLEVVAYDTLAGAIYTKSSLTINFTSACSLASNATLDASVTTINGVASATFEDLSCATAFGNEDTIVATASVNGTDITASHEVVIEAEGLGSIEFVSATPESIVLKGTGGQGKQESSTLTFIVKGELGNPLAQQTVNFELNNTVGGLALTSATGITNTEGRVSAKVTSGTVPAAVRVTATVTNSDNNKSIQTQSDLLSVNTGLPDQNSITIALSTVNPEARNRIGEQVTVSAYMADSFNNPVPDGTTINFTTEGGSIGASCNTVSGTCSVEWTSQEPYMDDHRVTILATAIGHETFVDVNGNNYFDDEDGAVATANDISSGFDRVTGLTSGFVDMSEVWRDDNENRVYDSGEQILGANDNNAFDPADGLFNGPQCDGALCAGEGAKSITVRKAAVLITSSSNAKYRITDTNSNEVYRSSFDNTATGNSIVLASGANTTLRVELSDTADQVLPEGTIISISASSATYIGPDSITIASTIGTSDPNGYGGLDFEISLFHEVDEPTAGELNIVVAAPSGIRTEVIIPIILQ